MRTCGRALPSAPPRRQLRARAGASSAWDESLPRLWLAPLLGPAGVDVREAPGASLDPAELLDLWQAAGVCAVGERSLERTSLYLERCPTCVMARAAGGERLVGFARAISGGGFFASQLEVVVHPEWTRRGVGTELVRRAARGGEGSVVAFAPVEAESFLQRCGFRTSRKFRVLRLGRGDGRTETAT